MSGLLPKLLVFVDWFAPGYKGGGQIQSCVNLSKALQHKMDIHVVTTDRDLGSDSAYDSVLVNTWTVFDKNISVIYLSPDRLSYKSIKSIVSEVNADTIYLNSMFSVAFTLLPLEVCRSENWKRKVILAPRGMLHSGALQYKRLKKQLFFKAFRLRRFHKRIFFHATDQAELKDIQRVFGTATKAEFVEDFPSSSQEPLTVIEKVPGSLRCLFVSRISPKKNLILLMDLLAGVTEDISLTIVGPAEDQSYWNLCQEKIKALPANVTVSYTGAVPNDQLAPIYRSHHLFTLPTFGENFGHVIFEALLNGRPVLISNRTPWKNLQAQQAGWDLPLDQASLFVQALKEACAWDNQLFRKYCEGSWKIASILADTRALTNKYLTLFTSDHERKG